MLEAGNLAVLEDVVTRKMRTFPLNVFSFPSKALPFEAPLGMLDALHQDFPLVLVYNYLVFMLPSKGFVLVLGATVGAT